MNTRHKKMWGEFEKDVRSMVGIMGDYRPDIIVPSMCGGLVPAGMVSELLGVKDVRPISIERRGDERIIVYDVQGDVAGKSILLLEDDLPSGKGFLHAKGVYEGRGAEVKIAAVYVNSKSEAVADFYGQVLNPLPDLPWKPARSGDRIVR